MKPTVIASDGVTGMTAKEFNEYMEDKQKEEEQHIVPFYFNEQMLQYRGNCRCGVVFVLNQSVMIARRHITHRSAGNIWTKCGGCEAKMEVIATHDDGYVLSIGPSAPFDFMKALREL